MSNRVDPIEILKALICFETVNPPGNERACILYIAELLKKHGIAVQLLSNDSNRPNLVARISGRGLAPPLLLYGHVDVVPTDGQSWSVPPFEGIEKDGYIWGRGALDMKSGVAMLLTAFINAAGEPPNGDLVLTVLSDEEAGGHQGAEFLVANHSGLFDQVVHAIGEFGGFTLHIGGKRFYPIQVAEKQHVAVKIRFSGDAGHAALMNKNNAIASAAKFLTRLSKESLPIEMPEITKKMIGSMASVLPMPKKLLLLGLLNPLTRSVILKNLGNSAAMFEPLLRSKVTPTIIHGGTKNNVVPEYVDLEIDARLLPGFSVHRLRLFLEKFLPNNSSMQMVASRETRSLSDLSQLPLMASIISSLDPGGITIPMITPGVTDARYFDQLGIQTYGFLPTVLPQGFSFLSTIHGKDERVPVSSLVSGSQAIIEFIRRYA